MPRPSYRPQQRKNRSHLSASSSSSSSAYPVYNPFSHPQHVPSSQRSPSPPPSGSGFSIQAYEVSLIRGRAEEGREMEMRRVEAGSAGVGETGVSVRGRLLRWEREGGDEGEQREVWVDRFSHLHLLPSLPLPAHQPSLPIPGSPTLSSGWSDLPSDTEDTFFFSEDEAEDYERDKKRRRLKGLRGGRLAALGGDVVDEPGEEEEVNREDEVPPPPILTLMRHTSHSLLSSPSPRVLELRILANHGADPRFAFMRGKWKAVWDALLAGKTVTEEGVIVEPKAVEEKKVGMAGLMGGYGSDSDSESGSGSGSEKGEEGDADTMGEEEERKEEGGEKEEPVVEKVTAEETEEEREKKRRRKEKALEWARKRKEGAEGGGASVGVASSSLPPLPVAEDL